MTAARSDLMALAWRLREAAYFCTKLEDLEDHCKQVATELDRLAASQPDREVLARAIEGIILRRMHEKRIEGYTLEMSLEQADAILSLLSGAGTKSDGGVEGHAATPIWVSADRKVDASSCSIQEGSHSGQVGIKPGPSDPSPGPDVKPAPIHPAR